MKANRREVLMLALLAVVVASAACSTISVSSKQYLGAPAFAPTNPDKVELLRTRPHRPHEKLGEVKLEPSGNPSTADLEMAMKKEAAKMGADAVVIVRDATRREGTVIEGGWWDRQAYPVYGRVIVGVAIRYR
jgi:hypothetical protein